ncbi:MAG: hypothetical protein LKE44_11350 [Eubacterium sp.]|jgi:PKD repeat protein|nr:hypothetical protein [Eubacterium sp.]MCH3955760.1 hypothetical protein [Eubacterium sp.]
MTRTKSSRALLSVVLAVLMVAAFMPALTYSSFAATAKKATKVTKLNHTGAKVYGKVGNKYVLKYKLSPSKLTSAAKKTVWKSSDSSIVKVYSTKGKHAAVKVKGVGTAKITVYTKANKKAKAVWSFKTKKVEAAAPTIDTSKVQTTYGLSTQYNMVDKSITTADLLKNVTAKDANGKDVTVSIASIKEVTATSDSINAYQTVSEVGLSNAGKHFEVTYTATDANGKTATKTVVVTVKNLDPVVTANNFSVAIDADNTANNADFAKKNEGEKEAYLINKGIVSVDDYESYPATTKAEDKTPAAFREVTANATEGHKNTIEVVKVTDASGKALEKTDKTTGKTTVDLSSIKMNQAGTYNITYKVTDYLGASVEKTVTMTVANNQAPTIATTSAKVYEGSKDPEADVLAQLTYNDAEDRQNVKVTKDNLTDSTGKTIAQVKFIDANGNEVKTNDPYFFTKVAKAYVVNVRDNNGAFAQTKLIDITVAKGIELTAKDQTIDMDVKAPAETTINPMQFITATLNGAAYTLDNPATTTKGGNTSYTIKDSTGKEVPSISAKTAGTYTVTYTVTDKDTKLTATKTISVKVVDKDAEAKAAKDKAVSDAIKAIQAIKLVDDKQQPVKTADLQAQVDTAQKAYDAVKALDDPALLSKISTDKLDAAKAELQKRADDAKAANDAELIKAAVSAATPSQGTDYTYKGKITVNGTDVTATGDPTTYLKKPNKDTTTPAVADLAQFLGGLYKSGKVSEIKFNGSTYTWNQEGTLKGSNWSLNGKTLVSAIADAYQNAKPQTNTVTLTLVNGKAEVQMTYTVSIATK